MKYETTKKAKSMIRYELRVSVTRDSLCSQDVIIKTALSMPIVGQTGSQGPQQMRIVYVAHWLRS